MLYRDPDQFSPLSTLRKFVCVMAIGVFALLPSIGPVNAASTIQSNGELRFELPANGNLRVENLRGAVMAEIWQENYVSVSAVSDNGELSTTPPVVDRGEGLLSIRLARAPKAAPHVNLQLHVPARAHVAIQTADGAVQVGGLPAALLAQSFSGEIGIDLPLNSDANLVADSKTGNVTSSIAALAVNRGLSPQLQGRIGSGTTSVRLYSQAGNINLSAGAGSSARTVSSAPTRRVPLDATETPTPKQRPDLVGPKRNTAAAGTPAPATTAPEEISEGDVIRVDTELVGLNVSVVDRGTKRGVNDLTNDDLRLYEDNAQQQIAHFESASAPFNLVLLIDLSGSTTKVVDLIKAAALHFVEAARPFDRIGGITFAGGQAVVSPLPNDHEALRQRIGDRKSTRLNSSHSQISNAAFCLKKKKYTPACQ